MKNIAKKLMALGLTTLMIGSYAPTTSFAAHAKSYDAVTQATSGSTETPETPEKPDTGSDKDDQEAADLTVDAVKSNAPKITGKATAGATVVAYVDGEEIGSATVKSNGQYMIKIAKQKKGTVITVEMTTEDGDVQAVDITVDAKNGNSENDKNNKEDKDDQNKGDQEAVELTVDAVKSNAPKITGKATVGAKVVAYVDGEEIGSATVKSNGQYMIKIAKQKKGTVITVEMTTEDGSVQSKEVTVLNKK